MTAPQRLPHAVFSGALGDNVGGGWYPAAGTRVSRLGHGAIAAIECGGALLIVVATLVITVMVLDA